MVLFKDFRKEIQKEQYLSDGAYVALYNGAVVLFTTNRGMVTNEVHLDGSALIMLAKWVREINE